MPAHNAERIVEKIMRGLPGIVAIKILQSEYHTGFRAYSKESFQPLALQQNSDDFSFVNQMLAQTVIFG
jgi:hypothetical protein